MKAVAVSIKTFEFGVRTCPKRKMSSMYLRYKKGLYGTVSNKLVSISPMNM